MWLLCGAIAFLLLLAHLYVRKRFSYWRNRGVVSTSPNNIFGDAGNALLKGTHIANVYDAIYKAYPNEKIVGIYELMTPTLLIRDPQLFETILVKDFGHFQNRINNLKPLCRLDYHLFTLQGDEWRAVRSKLVPTFTSTKLKKMIPMMEHCAKILDSRLSENTSAGESFNAKELAARFATDVIGCCMFGLHFNALNDPDSEYRKIGRLIFSPKFRTNVLFLLRIMAPKLVEFFGVAPFSPEISSFFFNLLKRSEELRQKESTRRNDLMQLMLDIRDQDEKDDSSVSDGVTFNDNIIVSNLFIFFSAGFETTSSTLTYCLYELALNSQVQQRLRDEIQTTLKAQDGEELTYETLKKMTYMDMVLSEITRKYTPTPFLRRVVTTPYTLPGTSLTLQPGTSISLAVYSIHRDEQYYPDPEKFDPERFTPENIAKRPAFTFLPFGDGPRMCIAARFAKLEIKLCLVRLLSKYEFSCCAKTEIPIQMRPRAFLLMPKNEVYLQVKKLGENSPKISS